MELEFDEKGLKFMSSALKQVHRASYPNAIRSTLNSVAFSAKKDKLKKSADYYFEDRTKGKFLKSHSKTDKAKGYDVNKMASHMGIISKGDKAAKNLKQQEKGGRISSRAFIQRDSARTSKNFKRKVSKQNRLDNIDIIDHKNATQNNRKSKAAASINIAAKKGKSLLMNNTLYRVAKIRRKTKYKNQIKNKITPIYSYKKGRAVTVSKRPFIERSGKLAAKDTSDFFKKEFDFEIKKLIRKGKL